MRDATNSTHAVTLSQLASESEQFPDLWKIVVGMLALLSACAAGAILAVRCTTPCRRGEEQEGVLFVPVDLGLHWSEHFDERAAGSWRQFQLTPREEQRPDGNDGGVASHRQPRSTPKKREEFRAAAAASQRQIKLQVNPEEVYVSQAAFEVAQRKVADQVNPRELSRASVATTAAYTESQVNPRDLSRASAASSAGTYEMVDDDLVLEPL